MANRYWVGGTESWDTTAGSKWSLTSGGSGGEAVPTSSDTVFFNAASGAVTVTIASGAICSTLTMTGFTGTLAFGSNSISCAGTGTVFAGATTFSVTGTPLINIIGTGVGTRAVNTGAVTEANSISFNVSAGTSQLSIVSGSRIRSLIFSGTSTGSLNAGTSSITIYGDLTFKAGMTITGGSGTKTFAATSGTQNITSPDGVAQLLNFPITFSGTATYKLQTDVNQGFGRSVTLSSGTLDLNGFGYVSDTFTIGAGTKNITFNGGTISDLSSGTFNNANPTGFTTTAGTGTGYISCDIINGGGSTYNCTLQVQNSVTVNGDNTFNDIANFAGASATVLFTAGTTNTFNNFNLLGSAGNLITIGSTTAGSTFTLSKSSGTVSGDYLSISDSVATGGATWYAGANSTNGGNNTGWTFTAPPGGTPIVISAGVTISGGVTIG